MSKKKRSRVKTPKPETVEVIPFSTPQEFADRVMERVQKKLSRKSISGNIPIPKKRDQ